MDAQSVTLIVAAVAATASLANMGVNIFFSRKATREEQFRDLLKPHIIQLGEELHQVVACCFTIAAASA